MLSLSRLRTHGAARAVALAALVLVTTNCASTPTAPRFADGTTRVLFLGNSLTYTNDLPRLVETLAPMAGVSNLRTAVLAGPDFALEDHWNEGVAARWLKNDRWEFVVLQQGSSALPASQVHLRTWTEAFAPLIRDAGAKPVLLMVWPTQDRLFDFPNVQQSYRNAAASVNGLFAPAGDAWVAFGNYSQLYSDGLHPTIYGSYLAALTVLEKVAGVRPDRFPPVIPGASVDSITVRKLQAAAWTAIQRNGNAVPQ
ncbi:MAG: hypothetical protein LCH84_08895 [Gemmatimonadetes bacterium]|nr:hypothetical protein [Gemmatimonadota bacterium]